MVGAPEDVGAFGHEVYAAKHNVSALRRRGLLREFVGVTLEIRETDHFVALIVMPEDDALFPQRLSGSRNAGVHREIGEYQIVVERTALIRRNSCSHSFSRLQFRNRRNGDVESFPLASADALPRWEMLCPSSPTRGDVEARG